MAVAIEVDGRALEVAEGTTVAAAVALAGTSGFRRGVRTGRPRGPVCGMGICFECRVTVNGIPHVRSCMALCAPGMEIETDAGA